MFEKSKKNIKSKRRQVTAEFENMKFTTNADNDDEINNNNIEI